MLLLLPPLVAVAQDAACQSRSIAEFERGLEEVDAAFVGLRFDQAKDLLDRQTDQVRCLVEIVPTSDVAAFDIRKAYAGALSFDPEETVRWGNAARALRPDIQWPSYVPEHHYVRTLLSKVAPVDPAELPDGLVVPESGGVFLDGRFRDTPTAEPDVPHLLQVGDATGRVIVSQWQEGTGFPPALLGPRSAEPPPRPDWSADRASPRPPRGRLLAAAALGAGAGASYVTSWVARGAYARHPTDGWFYVVDGSVVASSGAGLAAVGLAVSALAGDGWPR
jgi:hypothetical protein